MPAWTTETAKREELYIQRITDLYLTETRKPKTWELTADFNHDAATFARYCDMQARSLYAAGFNGRAFGIDTCALDVRRHYDLSQGEA